MSAHIHDLVYLFAYYQMVPHFHYILQISDKLTVQMLVFSGLINWTDSDVLFLEMCGFQRPNFYRENNLYVLTLKSQYISIFSVQKRFRDTIEKDFAYHNSPERALKQHLMEVLVTMLLTVTV